MTTLAVLAFAGALAAPTLLLMAPNMALKRAARDVYSHLHKAKMQAIRNNKSITVRFSGQYYYIDTDGDGACTLSSVDSFTDSNGDGVYSAGEPYRDLDGNGTYSGEIATSFSRYGYDVKRGTGNATANWSGNSCVQAAAITFNSRGTSNSGSVFLANKNNDLCYAVTVRTSGSLRIRKYSGATPFDKKYWD